MSIIGKIMDFEEGLLSENETISLFSELVKDGLVWSLQGSYGRTAKSLIEQGILADDGTVLKRMVNGELVEVNG